jgi:phospho-N-acetylmuramoyl-pentapeptide-transferase
VVSLVITMIGTPTLIRVVHKLHYGQYIRQDGPQSHQVKRGTPTLGGVVIVLAVLLGWGASALYRYCSQHRAVVVRGPHPVRDGLDGPARLHRRLREST